MFDSFEYFLDSLLPAFGTGNVFDGGFWKEKEDFSQKQFHAALEAQGRHSRAGKFTTDEAMS